MRAIAKRYQIWVKQGKEWSPWFPYNGDDKEIWQLKPHLKNEYKYK